MPEPFTEENKLQVHLRYGVRNSKTQRGWLASGFLLAGWLLLGAAGLVAGWLAGWLLTGCWLAKGFAADWLSVCWPYVACHAKAPILICFVVYGIKPINRTHPYESSRELMGI